MLRPTTLVTLLTLCAFAHAETVSPKVVERYKQMLAANPVEGVALDRVWKIYSEEGRGAELIKEYQGAGSFVSELILGHLLRKAGRDEDAASAYGRAAALDPTSALPHLSLARLDLERTRPREAALALEKALNLLPKDDPKHAEVLLQLGGAWLASGETAKAAEAWERAVALAPESLDLRRRLANAYADRGLHDEAIRHLGHLVEHAPPSERPALYQQMARVHQAAGYVKEAMYALEKAISLTAPENWLRHELLQQLITLAQRNHIEANLEAQWKDAATVNPRDVGALLQLVEFYERTGNLEEQRIWLEKIVQLTPKNGAHRLRLARLLVQLDEVEKAAALYDQLLGAQPDLADAVFERMELDLQMEDTVAMRDRLRGFMGRHKEDASLRGRALEFLREHHLQDLVEEHLKVDAARGDEAAVQALANFYFIQRRGGEGVQALRGLIRAEDPPARKSAMVISVVQTLKSQGELDAALVVLDEAVQGAPESREQALLRGEVELALFHPRKAQAAFEQAWKLAETEAQRLEADEKILQSLRANPAPTGGDQRRILPAADASVAVDSYLQSLVKAANEKPSAAVYLRAAQWKAWVGDKGGAVSLATKAAETEPKASGPREFLVRLLSTNGDFAFASSYLQDLVRLNPEGRTGYLRQIAQLQMQQGDTASALKTFAQLVEDQPGNVASLFDLASAQETASKLEDALTTWQKVYALVQGPRKSEARSAVLRILDRLARFAEASTLLLRAVDEATDERERFGRFAELLLHAQDHRLLPGLRAQFQARIKQRADDYFTAIALGRIYKLTGEKEAALLVFSDAIFSAPNQADALPDLVREAEELRRFDIAVRLQEQLIRVAPKATPESHHKLAMLQEKIGDLAAVERSWTRVVAKFPRDPGSLRGAADFHLTWGDARQAVDYLRRLYGVDPADVRAVGDLGQLEFEAGRFAEARTAFATVLKLTRPSPGTQQFPAELGNPWLDRRPTKAALVLYRTETAATPAKPDADTELRLNAIRRLGEMIRQGGDSTLRAEWISQWTVPSEPAPFETLWALYFCGAREQAWERMRDLARQEPANPRNGQALMWCALESGLYAHLSTWLEEGGRSAEDWSLFSQAFVQFIRAKPEAINSAMVTELFPPSAQAQLWPSAVELARSRHLPEAISLGRRVFERLQSQRAYYGREVAQWCLAAGQPKEAELLLREVVKAPGDHFESVVYGALHDLLFLLPEEERSKFVGEYLTEFDDQSLHGLISRVVLGEALGRHEEARAALDQLLLRRPLGMPGGEVGNSALRGWEFLFNAAGALVEWRAPDLAEYLWERIFADPALLRIQVLQPVREAIPTPTGRALDSWSQRPAVAELITQPRNQYAALRYVRGGVVERMAVLAERERAGGDESLFGLGEALENLRATTAALEVYQHAWERNVRSVRLLRKLLDLCRMTGDDATAETVRRRCVAERINPGSEITPQEFAVELSELLEKRGATAEALKVIGEALVISPGEMRLLQRQARLFQHLGKAEESKRTWRNLVGLAGGTLAAREELALALEEQGKFSDALAVRLGGGATGDARVPLLYYRVGRAEDALIAAGKLTGSAGVFAAMSLAENFALKGQLQLARSVLIDMASRAGDARSQMQLRSKLVTLPGAPVDPVFVMRMQTQLRSLAKAQPELSTDYHEFFEDQADRLGIRAAWDAEVRAAWQDGKGELAAGVVLVGQQVTRKEDAAARRTTEQILERADVAGGVLARLDAGFQKTGALELRALCARTAARRAWPFGMQTCLWMGELNAQGRGEEARIILTDLAWLQTQDDGAEWLGRAWLELGDAAQAGKFFTQAFRNSRRSGRPDLLAALARVQLLEKQLPAARLLLRQAFAFPGCHEHETLVRYLRAGGLLEQWREVADDLGLSAYSRYLLQIALFSDREKQGEVAEALKLVVAEPTLVLSSASPRSGEVGASRITCARLRALGEKSGRFAEVAEVLQKLADSGSAEAAVDLALVYADWAATSGDASAALPHLQRACALRPAGWEGSRRLAELQLFLGARAESREVLEAFLTLSGDSLAREEAFALWEKAGTVGGDQ